MNAALHQNTRGLDDIAQPHLARKIRTCAACSGGIHSIHIDGCFMRQLWTSGVGHGDPNVAPSMFGDYKYDGSTLRNDEWTKFSAWRDSKLAGGGAAAAAENSFACPDFRQTAKAEQGDRNYRVSGMYIGVCSHGIAEEGGGSLMMTAGEGLQYAHYFLRKRLHLSGQLPLEEVFGQAPEPRSPELSHVFIDVPCILQPHLERHDGDVLKHISLHLGKVLRMRTNANRSSAGGLQRGLRTGAGKTQKRTSPRSGTPR